MFKIDKSGFFSDMKNTTKNNRLKKFNEENEDPESFKKSIIHNIKLAKLESGILASLNIKSAISKAAKNTVNKQAKLTALVSSRDSSTNAFSYSKNSILMAIEKKKLNMLSKLYKSDNLNNTKVVVPKKNATDVINSQKESNEDDENTEDFRYELLEAIELSNDLTEKTNKILSRIEKNSLLSGGRGGGLLGGLVDGVDLDLDRDKKGKGRGKGGRARLNRVPGFDIPESSKDRKDIKVDKNKPNNSPTNNSKTIDPDKKGGKVNISGNSKVNIDIDNPSSKFGKIGSMLKKGVKFIPGIGMVAAIGTAGYSAFKGFTDDASAITGIDEEDLTTLDKTMSGLSAVIEDLSFGLLNSEDTFNFFNNTTADISNAASNAKDALLGDSVDEKANYETPEEVKNVKTDFTTSGNFKEDVKRNTRFLETSKYEGDYAKTGDIGDKAGISFGAYQLTEKSGGVQEYIKKMGKYDPEAKAISDNYKGTSKEVISNYLKKSGSTEQGRAIQDGMYDEKYYNPVMKLAAKKGITNEASIAQMLDHQINSGKASRMLQFTDGDYSPESIAKARREHYQAIADHDPDKKKYLKNWNNRVNKFDKNFKSYSDKNITPVDNLKSTNTTDGNSTTTNPISTNTNINTGTDNVDAHLEIVKKIGGGNVSDTTKPLDKATLLPDMSNSNNNSNSTPVLNNQNNSSSNSSVINNNIVQPDNSFGLSNSNLTQYLKA